MRSELRNVYELLERNLLTRLFTLDHVENGIIDLTDVIEQTKRAPFVEYPYTWTDTDWQDAFECVHEKVLDDVRVTGEGKIYVDSNGIAAQHVRVANPERIAARIKALYVNLVCGEGDDLLLWDHMKDYWMKIYDKQHKEKTSKESKTLRAFLANFPKKERK